VNKQQVANSTARISMVSRVAACLVLGAGISDHVALAGDGPESDAPSVVSRPSPREFAPMTRGERFRNDVLCIAGPQPFITAAARAGVSQAEETPKEWGGGAEGYGRECR
jgi:hypothetical protein